MKYLQHILYGVIVGRWLLAVKGRLTPTGNGGRYIIVAMHSMHEEFIMVGKCANGNRAQELAQIVEDDTNEYITIIYDAYDKADMDEIKAKLEAGLFRTRSDNPVDQRILEDVSDMCDVGDM